jgi:hypothetical protein
MEYYTQEYIAKKYDKLPLKIKNTILYNAIDYMEQYNGRSKFLCIAMAMGYDNYEGNNNSYYRRIKN